MAATLQEKMDTGGTDANPANQDVIDALGPPKIKFKTADNKTIDNVNPIPKPASGTVYSFWKSIYLRCSVAPSSQCDNFKYYTDGGGFGDGITIKIGTQHPVKTHNSDAGYEVATGTIGETGNEMVAAHAGLSASSSLFGYTASSPKSVSCSEIGSVINSQNETTDYILLQAEVTNAATAGTPSNETFTWKWDEI